MNEHVESKRSQIRRALEKNLRHSGKDLLIGRLTDLGMHYIDVEGTPVLVTVEINVARILAVLGERLSKSKSGVARLGNGSIRLTIATAEGREICGATREGKR